MLPTSVTIPLGGNRAAAAATSAGRRSTGVQMTARSASANTSRLVLPASMTRAARAASSRAALRPMPITRRTKPCALAAIATDPPSRPTPTTASVPKGGASGVAVSDIVLSRVMSVLSATPRGLPREAGLAAGRSQSGRYRLGTSRHGGTEARRQLNPESRRPRSSEATRSARAKPGDVPAIDEPHLIHLKNPGDSLAIPW